MAWDYEYGDGVDVGDDGIPRHPEKGYPVCGYPKTDAVANNGRKRGGEGDGCLLAAGWGSDRTTGACRKHHGGGPGGPTGWANGNARHLLFSERMNDDDQEIFDAVVKDPTADDDEAGLLSIDDMADMLKNSIGWEYTRLARAIDHIPDAQLIEMYECPTCGESYRNQATGDCTGSIRTGPSEFSPCPYDGPYEAVDGKAWVDFGDKSVERKENHLANLIATYKKIADGVDVHVDGSHDVTHKGDPDEPVEVEINHVAVDLPDDVDEIGAGDDGGDDE